MYLAAVVFFARRNEKIKKKSPAITQSSFLTTVGTKKQEESRGERAGRRLRVGEFRLRRGGGGGEIAYKGDQVRQEIFHEILKRRCLRLLLPEDVRWRPLTFSSALSSLCRDVCESRRSTCKETVNVP